MIRKMLRESNKRPCNLRLNSQFRLILKVIENHSFLSPISFQRAKLCVGFSFIRKSTVMGIFLKALRLFAFNSYAFIRKNNA